jgi:hypothetical protein
VEKSFVALTPGIRFQPSQHGYVLRCCRNVKLSGILTNDKRNLVLFLTWKVLLCFEVAFKIHLKRAILSFKSYFLYLGKRLFLGAVKLRSQISFS